MSNATTTEPIRAVDLFAGAGGLSWGLVQALREVVIEADQPTEAALAELIDLVAINHWEQAIETHRANHPWARHYHDDIAHVDPAEVFEDPDPDVTILSGGIECTHWSTARGGKPVDEQKRMPAWDFLTWVQKLRPRNVLVENVREFTDWGPIDDDGMPTRTGETFEAWIDSLHALGYSVDWAVLNAADYGDATSRKRLFVMASREGTPRFPEPTHAEDPEPEDGRAPWRTASEIIDWSDPGGSIWTRDLDDARKRPLKYTTMRRIAEGLRRHCDGRLAPLADALDRIGRVDDSDDVDAADFWSVETLREQVVPARFAGLAARTLDRPFLVAVPGADQPLLAAPAYCLRQQSGGVPSPADVPLPTISSAGSIATVAPRPLVMPRNGARRGLHSNALYPPEDRPLHTVTAQNTDGYLVSPYLCPLYSGRTGQRPRTRSVDRPLLTIPASKSPAGLATPTVRPFLDDCQGAAQSVGQPLKTQPASDRYALCVPEAYPWGLDVRYRMLQPRELKRAQGFPDGYEIRGTKRDVTRQIGNAVPVTLAQRLVESLLADRMPALTDYVDDEPASVGVNAPGEVSGGAVGDD